MIIGTRKLKVMCAVLVTGLPIFIAQGNAAQDRGRQTHTVQTPQGSNNNAHPHQQNRENAPSPGNLQNRRDGNHGRGNEARRDQNRWNGWNENRRSDSDRSADRHDRDRDRDRDEHRDRERRDHRWNNYGYGSGLYFGYGGGYPTYPDRGYYNADPYRAGYSDGFAAGQFDRNQGNLYNPRQYERSDNPDYFEGFVAGYQDGFRR